jgi:drug/metabolite transporter (DMT)-like permease
VNLFLFFLLTVFWGFSFIAIRYSLEMFPPFMAACLRIFLSCAILWLYAKYKKRPNLIDKKLTWYSFWLGILLFGIPWAALFWGEQFVSPSIASIINSTVPIFVLILSWAMLPDEQPNLSSTIGVLFGFVGMFYVFSPGAKFEFGNVRELQGLLSIVVMAISYALGAVSMKKLPKDADRMWILILQAFAGSIFLAIASFFKGETIVSTEHAVHATIGLLYLAICSTVIASLVYYHLLTQWGVLKTVTVTYLSPFVAIVADIILLNLHLKKNEMIGGTIILAGLLLIHWSKTKNVHKLFRKKAI